MIAYRGIIYIDYGKQWDKSAMGRQIQAIDIRWAGPFWGDKAIFQGNDIEEQSSEHDFLWSTLNREVYYLPSALQWDECWETFHPMCSWRECSHSIGKA